MKFNISKNICGTKDNLYLLFIFADLYNCTGINMKKSGL